MKTMFKYKILFIAIVLGCFLVKTEVVGAVACPYPDSYSTQIIEASGNISSVSAGEGLGDKAVAQEIWWFSPTNSWNWRQTEYFSLSTGWHTIVLGEHDGKGADISVDRFYIEPQSGVTPDELKIQGESGELFDCSVQSDGGASGGQYAWCDEYSWGRMRYTFNVVTAGNYRINARVISPTTDSDGYINYAIYDVADWRTLGGTASVTIPEGATIRPEDVYILWGGFSEDGIWTNDEAHIKVNDVSVSAASSDWVKSGDRETYWAKIPAAAQTAGPSTFNFTVTEIFDFMNPRIGMAPWGFGVVVIYEHPSFSSGLVQFRPWGNYVRPVSDPTYTGCTSTPMTFSFSALPGARDFNPFFFASDTNVNGYDTHHDWWRPNYLEWTYGTGSALTGSYSWQDAPVHGYSEPPDKTRAYFGEARDGMEFDTVNVNNGIIDPLPVPAGTTWIAFRLRVTGRGDDEPTEPLNSTGESMTWSGGGGTFQPVIPTQFPVTPTPTLTPTPVITPTPTPTLTPTPTMTLTPTPSTTPMPEPAWLNSIDGNLYANANVSIQVPSGKHLVEDSSDASRIGGMVVTSSIFIAPGSAQRSERDWSMDSYAVDTTSLSTMYVELQDKYEYDEATVITSLDGLTADGVYKVVGSLTLNDLSLSSIRSDDVQAIVFVHGNLTINNDFSPAPPKDASDTEVLTYRDDFIPSLMFIIRDDLTINPSVESIYGIYLVGADSSTGSSNNRLSIFGLLSLLETAAAGPRTVHFGRDLGVDNFNLPGESFVFMPKYFFTLEDLAGESRISWLEAGSGNE